MQHRIEVCACIFHLSQYFQHFFFQRLILSQHKHQVTIKPDARVVCSELWYQMVCFYVLPLFVRSLHVAAFLTRHMLKYTHTFINMWRYGTILLLFILLLLLLLWKTFINTCQNITYFISTDNNNNNNKNSNYYNFYHHSHHHC